MIYLKKIKVKLPLVSKLSLSALLAITVGFSSFAQTTAKKITTRPVAWYGYINSLQLSPKWTLTTDIGERNYIDNGKQAQFLIRSKVNYVLGQNWDAGIGFAYFETKTFDPASTSTLGVPELRPFQEFNNKQKFNKITLSHRYRIEERYFKKTASDKLIDGYNFNFRFRYMFTFEYNLYKSKDNKKSFGIKAGDEIMVNAGKNIVNNMFDQNRLFAAVNYQPVNNLSFEIGYMNSFQEKSSGTQFNNANIYRLSIFHKIKLYK